MRFQRQARQTSSRWLSAEEFRTATRARIIALRDDLAGRELAGATIRRKLSAASSLFEYL